MADDELGRVYLAEENIGGIWRYGAEPGDSTTGVKIDSTTERGGNLVQDVKGLALYFGSNGAGYLLAASQGSDLFHIYNRSDNAHVGAFKVVAGSVIDGVEGEDGIDVTSFALGTRFPYGFFVSQDHTNTGGGNQNFKVVPWEAIANAFTAPLLIDPSWDPRLVGDPNGGGTAPDTRIDSGPAGSVNATSAVFAFSSTEAGSGFECALDAAAFAVCSSLISYNDLAEGSIRSKCVRWTSPATSIPLPAAGPGPWMSRPRP